VGELWLKFPKVSLCVPFLIVICVSSFEFGLGARAECFGAGLLLLFSALMEFTPQQIAVLERLHSQGFEIVAFPMYANYVGIRKGDCAVLLAQLQAGTFSICAKPTFLIAGNFAVRITRDGRDFFVWKKDKLEATPARLAQLESFAAGLSEVLLPRA